MKRLGILGGGQLGRMLALAAYPLGVRPRILETAPGGPAAGVAELHVGPLDHPELLARFADGLDVVTYEFENVPVSSARFLSHRVPVYPPPEALEVAQDRLHEKTMFRRLGLPTPEFQPVGSRAELSAAVGRVGLPGVLKTRRLGYDGKGQHLLRTADDLDPAWAALGGVPLILEQFIPFDREVSVLAVRDPSGATVTYPPVQNHHEGGILRVSRAPADVPEPTRRAAVDGVTRVLDALRYVGVLAVEFFEVGGRLLANEMAPRVHNSGHWTIEGAETSQFENHVRAVLGLPPGDPAPRGFSVMANLIGTVPDPADVLRIPGAHLHLYDKEPRPDRKLGHVTVHGPDPAAVEERWARVRAVISGPSR